jgi:hypothetical protein
LAFFAEFLATIGVYDSWLESCPLSYSSGNAPGKRDVLGTWFLSILAGHRRYAHITGLRGDGVSPQILGMSKIVSEDSLRRSLARMSAEQSQDWLRPQLLASVEAALNTPWILDIDTTIKTLFGKQSGAEVGYNPHKPGRPSHALHTYWVGNLRLVLDVVVSSGKQHRSMHARPGLSAVLDSLSREQLPALVRGDCGYGNEPFYPLDTMAQLYRDRADAENGFDELKNQWGWGGFTTQDMARCQTSARAVALVYNWWSWYCRAAKPGARMEAITSRALLLAISTGL